MPAGAGDGLHAVEVHHTCSGARRRDGRSDDPSAAAVAAVVAAQLMQVPAYLQRRLRLPVRQDILDEGGSILRASPPWR
jgi:hypothetical protein